MALRYMYLCLVVFIAVSSTNGLRFFDEYSIEYNESSTANKCKAIGGKCQSDGLHCAGSYVSDKCSGLKNIRCCTTEYIITDTGFCSESGVKIISRDSWGARRPKSTRKLKTPVNDFFIHHTDTPPCKTTPECMQRMKSIQDFHMDSRKWSDIAYSFLVGEDGNVYEGRGWNREGAHTRGYNKISLAASMIGNFTSRIPNPAALRAVKRLITCGAKKEKLRSTYGVFGHRDVGNTSCPERSNLSKYRNKSERKQKAKNTSFHRSTRSR